MAVLLAVVAVGYGGVLAVFMRTPTDTRVARVASLQPAEAQVVTALSAPATGDRSVLQDSGVNRPVVARTMASSVDRQSRRALEH